MKTSVSYIFILVCIIGLSCSTQNNLIRYEHTYENNSIFSHKDALDENKEDIFVNSIWIINDSILTFMSSTRGVGNYTDIKYNTRNGVIITDSLDVYGHFCKDIVKSEFIFTEDGLLNVKTGELYRKLSYKVKSKRTGRIKYIPN